MTGRTRLATEALAARARIAARPTSRYERYVKPGLDRVAAGVLLLVLLPLMAVVAAGVLVTLGRPVLYRQERIGFLGEPFEMLKFRSMRHDRRRRRTRSYDGPDRRRRHKTPDDPRLTAFGRFIRASSLDELPQLWNVLRGDLSLIGPRPELPQIVERYEPWQHDRHHVKPGVTGLWQVTERDHDGEMHRHVGTDLAYVDRVSPRLDAWIAVRTVPAVLGRRATPPAHLAPRPEEPHLRVVDGPSTAA